MSSSISSQYSFNPLSLAGCQEQISACLEKVQEMHLWIALIQESVAFIRLKESLSGEERKVFECTYGPELRNMVEADLSACRAFQSLYSMAMGVSQKARERLKQAEAERAAEEVLQEMRKDLREAEHKGKEIVQDILSWLQTLVLPFSLDSTSVEKLLFLAEQTLQKRKKLLDSNQQELAKEISELGQILQLKVGF